MTKAKDAESYLADVERASKDRRFVTALGRGLNILRCFRPGDGSLGNLELAKRTGLPKPTISRLTYTLTKLGYLVQTEQDGTYQLGPGVLQLGFSMLAGVDIRERARPLMQDMARKVDATIALGMPDRLEMVYLEVCRGPATVTLRIDVGMHIPMAATAMGRAYLAGLPADDRGALVERLKAAGSKDAARIDKIVKLAVADYATLGYCRSMGDWYPDVNAIAVPINARDGRIYGIICGGPAFKVTQPFLEGECAERLVAVAKSISQFA